MMTLSPGEYFYALSLSRRKKRETVPAEILEKSTARVSLLLLLAFFYISRRSRAVGLSRFPLLAGG